MATWRDDLPLPQWRLAEPTLWQPRITMVDGRKFKSVDMRDAPTVKGDPGKLATR